MVVWFILFGTFEYAFVYPCVGLYWGVNINNIEFMPIPNWLKDVLGTNVGNGNKYLFVNYFY